MNKESAVSEPKCSDGGQCGAGGYCAKCPNKKESLTDEPSEEVTWQQAADAVDAMDDYARMTIGVDPSGPRELLCRFILQQKRAAERR